jgi:hypothetical protein
MQHISPESNWPSPFGTVNALDVEKTPHRGGLCFEIGDADTEDALELGLQGSVDFSGWVELQPL